MSRVTVRNEVDLDDPWLVEGLPGVGLASKIATDHLISELDMVHHASVTADGLPEVMIFEEGERTLRPPVRIFADPETDLLVLSSDVIVSPVTAEEFAATVTDWIQDVGARPLFLSGLPSDADEKELFGVTTGDSSLLDGTDIPEPSEPGLVGGPTGALLHHADDAGIPGACLVVSTDPQFPDPAAARILIDDGIEEIAGFDVPTQELTERAEEIRGQKQKLAEMLQQAEAHEKSQAFPEGMYH